MELWGKLWFTLLIINASMSCAGLWKWSLAWRVTARYSQCTFTDCWSSRSASKSYPNNNKLIWRHVCIFDWQFCAFLTGRSVHLHICGQCSRRFNHDTERLRFHGDVVGGIASFTFFFLFFSSHLRLLSFGLPSNTESNSGQPEAALQMLQYEMTEPLHWLWHICFTPPVKRQSDAILITARNEKTTWILSSAVGKIETKIKIFICRKSNLVFGVLSIWYWTEFILWYIYNLQ